jgi:LysM repeat protein
MSQLSISILLLLALGLPVLGALLIRFLASRVAPMRLYGTAATIFGITIISVLWLARSQVPSLSFLGVSLVLPLAAPADQDLVLPPIAVAPAPDQQPPSASQVPEPTAGIAEPTATTRPTATARPTATSTARPTATTAPTEPPTATPVPPTETPIPPTAAPAGPRTYRVQPGDTLRSIAEQFNVSVQALLDANDLTPEEADSLRIDQELVIP